MEATRSNEHGQPIGRPVDGWELRPAPPKATLEGRYVRLEPATAEHAESLFDALCGPEEADLWTYRPDEPAGDVAEMARRLATAGATRESLTWALVPEGHEGAQGLVSLHRIDPAHGSAEVAAVLYGRALQRTRAATEAVRLLAGHLFDELGYRRLEWKCDSLNAPSRRAALRLGFTEEGTWRNALVYKGRNRDTTWFSITDQEWPQVSTRLDDWLDPGNFDVQGKQQRPLSQSQVDPSVNN